ncbi:MAG: SPASM domain-containing protein [Gorillibacterium sp.]|nr:SPASM domain-containing protein [Gorillibacterium sp.]
MDPLQLFKKVYIEITNVCNLSCSFCPGTTRPHTFMDTATFGLILSKLTGKTNSLYFHIMGEPLLHPKLDILLDMAYEAGFSVNITTNGTLIDRIGERLLAKPALRQINFSLHSRTESENFEQYVERIFTFIRQAQQLRQLYISLRLWNLSEDLHNPDNQWILAHIAATYALDRRILEDWDGRSGILLSPNVYLNQATVFEWPDIRRTEEYGSVGFCRGGLRDHLGILSDGTVVPCCLDGEGVVNLGNLITQPFAEIIESPRALAIIDGFSRRELAEELCRKCGYRQRFE